MRKAELLRGAARRANDWTMRRLWLEHAMAIEDKAANLMVCDAIAEAE